MTLDRPRTPSFRLKLVAAFVSALLILVVVWIGVRAISRTEVAQEWADHAVLVRTRAHAILNRLLEARLARATFIVSGDPAALENARGLRAVTRNELTALWTLTSGNPEQRRLLQSAAPFLELEVAGMEESLRYADREDLDGLTSIVLEQGERRNFERLGRALEEVAAEEEQHIIAHTTLVRERMEAARVLLIVGGGVAFLLVTFVIVRLRAGVRALQRAHGIIAAQARELAARGQRLERSLQELDEFAYVASHDLRAPLRAIATLATWIEEDVADLVSDEGREHLRLMTARVARMEALVEGVLAYARAGRTVDDSETIDVAALVREVIDLLEPPADVSVTVEGATPTIIVARTPFQQVWMNLLSNALKHGAKPGRVRVGVTGDEREPVYYVADDGPGIEPRYHARIFGLFQTLAARDRVESTGIGLAVVRKLVEQQGGHLWLVSDQGQGATFFFTFPSARPEPAPLTVTPPAPAAAPVGLSPAFGPTAGGAARSFGTT